MIDSNESNALLRQRVLDLKNQARRLYQSFERREISQLIALAEAQRLQCEVLEAERQIRQLERSNQNS